MTIFTFGHDTHIGHIRPQNEDCYLIDAELQLGVLADGMGGHECGEVASQIVVERIQEEVRAGTPMAEALVKAHHAVLAAVRDGKGRAGMGSTALAVKIDGDSFEVVWVGDSRAYLWSQGALTQITRDHSLVQLMVDQGDITAEEAEFHPQRNFITQAIGMESLSRLEVGLVRGRLYPGQQILLCSDGLSGELSVEEITCILSQPADEQTKVDRLIQTALDNGGSDNVTVLLVSAPPAKDCRNSE